MLSIFFFFWCCSDQIKQIMNQFGNIKCLNEKLKNWKFIKKKTTKVLYVCTKNIRERNLKKKKKKIIKNE